MSAVTQQPASGTSTIRPSQVLGGLIRIAGMIYTVQAIQAMGEDIEPAMGWNPFEGISGYQLASQKANGIQSIFDRVVDRIFPL